MQLAKGTNMVGLLDGKLYPLFNPRKQHGKRHFEWDMTTLVGKTSTGIVTIPEFSTSISLPELYCVRICCLKVKLQTTELFF